MSRVFILKLFRKLYKFFFSLSVDGVGSEDHELGRQVEVFFDIHKQVFKRVRGDPDGILEHDESGFLEKVSKPVSFTFAVFWEVEENNAPLAIPGRVKEDGFIFKLETVNLLFSFRSKAAVRLLPRVVCFDQS